MTALIAAAVISYFMASPDRVAAPVRTGAVSGVRSGTGQVGRSVADRWRAGQPQRRQKRQENRTARQQRRADTKQRRREWVESRRGGRAANKFVDGVRGLVRGGGRVALGAGAIGVEAARAGGRGAWEGGREAWGEHRRRREAGEPIRPGAVLRPPLPTPATEPVPVLQQDRTWPCPNCGAARTAEDNAAVRCSHCGWNGRWRGLDPDGAQCPDCAGGGCSDCDGGSIHPSVIRDLQDRAVRGDDHARRELARINAGTAAPGPDSPSRPASPAAAQAKAKCATRNCPRAAEGGPWCGTCRAAMGRAADDHMTQAAADPCCSTWRDTGMGNQHADDCPHQVAVRNLQEGLTGANGWTPEAANDARYLRESIQAAENWLALTPEREMRPGRRQDVEASLARMRTNLRVLEAKAAACRAQTTPPSGRGNDNTKGADVPVDIEDYEDLERELTQVEGKWEEHAIPLLDAFTALAKAWQEHGEEAVAAAQLAADVHESVEEQGDFVPGAPVLQAIADMAHLLGDARRVYLDAEPGHIEEAGKAASQGAEGEQAIDGALQATRAEAGVISDAVDATGGAKVHTTAVG